MTSPVARNRKGDYEVVDPKTGELRVLFGFSKTKNVLASPPLDTWKKKSIVLGLAGMVHEGDLSWATQVLDNDKVDRPGRDLLTAYRLGEKILNENKTAADLGTEVHHAIEMVTAGLVEVGGLAAHIRPFVEGWQAEMGRLRLTVVASEMTVCSFEYGYAGTLDLIVEAGWLGRCVADVKTGKAVYPDVALQLAAYSHAEHALVDNVLGVPPEGVRHDLGLVFHVTADGTTTRTVDLSLAWPAWTDIIACREWTDVRSKTALGPVIELVEVLDVALPEGPLADRERVAWVKARIKTIAEHPDGAGATLAQLWPDTVPVPKQSHSWTDAHVDTIVRLCVDIEGRHQMPFGDIDPTKVSALPAPVVSSHDETPTPERVEQVRTALIEVALDIRKQIVKASGLTVALSSPELRTVDLERLEAALNDARSDILLRDRAVLAACDAAGVDKTVMAGVVDLGAAQWDEPALRRAQAVAMAVRGELLRTIEKGRALRTTPRAGLVLNEIHRDHDACLAHVIALAPSAEGVSYSALLDRPLLVALAAWQPATTTTNRTTST